MNPPIDIVPGKSLHIFDLGNVLYSVDARRTLAALEALGMPRQSGGVSNSHAAGGVFGLYCDGKVSTAQFYDGVRRQCGISAPDDAIRRAWAAMMLGYRPEALETVRRVRASGCRVALLSNCNALHAEQCRAEFPGPGTLDDLFDGVFFSQDIGMSKPDPATWGLVLEAMGAAPADAAFYDDSPINTEAARRLGIEARLVG